MTLPSVGPLARNGPTLTADKANALRARRDACARCSRDTRQTAEVNVDFMLAHYVYRCETCLCIVESGLIAKKTRQPSSDDVPKKVRRPMEDD